MSVSKAVLISAKLAALAGAVLIAIAAPTASMAVSVAEDGPASQDPPAATPDGNSWGG